MPKFVKVSLILGMLLVLFGMLGFLIHGVIAPKTRPVLKLSGFSHWQELGKYSYRQLYAQASNVNLILLGESNPSELVEDFIEGFQAESLLHRGEIWQKKDSWENLDLNSGEKYLVKVSLDQSLPSSPGYIGDKVVGSYVGISFSNLLPPNEISQLSQSCVEQKKISLPCLKERVSFVSKAKWDKIQSCRRATLDQIGKYDFLVLSLIDSCEEATKE